MSEKSRDLRKLAARELRASRHGDSVNAKIESVKRSAAYKALSENEEWLDGEKPRSNPKPRGLARS